MAARSSEKTRAGSRSRSPAVHSPSRRAGSRSPAKRRSPAKAAPESPSKAAAATTVRRAGPSRVNWPALGKKALRVYLIAYNALSAAAWLFVLAKVMLKACPAFCLAWKASARQTRMAALATSVAAAAKAGHAAGACTLALVQSFAVLEVVHAALGLVPAPVMQTAVQVLSRLLVGVFVTYRLGVGRLTGHWGFLAIALCWSLADATRYVYYVTHLLGCTPAFLRWMRYSLFLVLYPLGTAGEMGLLWTTRLAMAGHVRHAMAVLIALYPLGLATMYAHMLVQRARHMPGAAARKSPRKQK